MRYASLFVLGLAVLCGGCGTWNDCIVHFEMREPNCPEDPNVMLAKLEHELPDDVEIMHYLWKKKSESMRGIVLVTSNKAGKKVLAAVRRDPDLFPVAGGIIQGAGAGEFMVCFSSRPPFEPKSDTEVLQELRRDVPDRVKISIDGSRRQDDGRITLWAIVHGNFGKEAVKFACRHNPNLTSPQVENSTFVRRLLLRRRIGRVKAGQ